MLVYDSICIYLYMCICKDRSIAIAISGGFAAPYTLRNLAEYLGTFRSVAPVPRSPLHDAAWVCCLGTFEANDDFPSNEKVISNIRSDLPIQNVV